MRWPRPIRKLAPSVRSLSYGAVRGYYRHEAILGELLSTPVRSLDFLVRALLSVALYETRGCAHAGVRRGRCGRARPRRPPMPCAPAGLINAVLRRYLRERKTLDAEIARNPATRHASPDLARGSSARRLAGALDAVAGRGRRAGADVVAGQQPACDHGRTTWRRSARRGSARARRRACRTQWRWTRPAMCMNCRDSPQGIVSVQDLGRAMRRISARRWPPVSGCSMPARRRAARPRSIAEREPHLARAGRGRHRSAAARAGAVRICSAADLRAELVTGDAARAGRRGGTACRSTAFCSMRPVRRSG